ncbi:MAG: 1,2-phenylacetyl-CoA epoxidase subunit PaaE [Polaromonas sp.]
MSTHSFHSLTVASVQALTRDSMAITLAVPEALQDTFAFVAGQYLTLRALIDGQEVRRSYSICSAVQDGRLRIAIKKVAGGAFSHWAASHLLPGAVIEAMPPQGHFHIPLQPEAARHVVAFAAGSGITPMLAIIKTMLIAEQLTRITLVYGNRASGNVMFKEELEDLKDTYLSRLNLVWVMSRETQDIELFNGRIDYDKTTELLSRWIDPASIDAAFICGPHEMMLAVTQALEDKGVDKSHIKAELFGAPLPARPRAASAAVQGGEDCEVEVMLDGARRTFMMSKNQSLVDGGLKAGLDMPYACKGGVCSTCRAQVLTGEVDMDNNFALEDYEVARGFVLCCQSFPVSNKLVIDFDQEHTHV